MASCSLGRLCVGPRLSISRRCGLSHPHRTAAYSPPPVILAKCSVWRQMAKHRLFGLLHKARSSRCSATGTALYSPVRPRTGASIAWKDRTCASFGARQRNISGPFRLAAKATFILRLVNREGFTGLPLAQQARSCTTKRAKRMSPLWRSLRTATCLPVPTPTVSSTKSLRPARRSCSTIRLSPKSARLPPTPKGSFTWQLWEAHCQPEQVALLQPQRPPPRS